MRLKPKKKIRLCCQLQMTLMRYFAMYFFLFCPIPSLTLVHSKFAFIFVFSDCGARVCSPIESVYSSRRLSFDFFLTHSFTLNMYTIFLLHNFEKMIEHNSHAYYINTLELN